MRSTIESTPRPPSRVPTGLGRATSATFTHTSDGASASASHVAGIGTNGDASVVREHFSVPRPLHAKRDVAADVAVAAAAAAAASVRAQTPQLQSPRTLEEVLLFCVHPHAILVPLQNRVNAKLKAVREWLIQELQKHDLYPNQAIVRLEKQLWYNRLFDVRALSQIINIFQHYLCQSDVLAIPPSYRVVYDAYTSEMNRTCSDSAYRDSAHALAAAKGACIMGGIDFTEETVQSTRRPLQFENSSTGVVFTKFATRASADATSPMDKIAINRACITSQDNLRLLTAFVPRLTQRCKHFKSVLQLRQRELGAQRQRVLAKQRKLAIDALLLAQQRLQDETRELASLLQMIHDAQADSRLSRARDAIAQDMQTIAKFANCIL